MRPITVIDWRADFTGRLADMLLERAEGDLRPFTVVFPHQRPKRHLMQRLATREDVPKPLFLPEMTAIGDWLPGLARELDPTPLTTAGPLDRVGLMREVVADLPGGGPLAELAAAPDRFFPWGRRLAELFEELFRHAVEPQDLAHLEGEVHDTAAHLLENLTQIHTGYADALAAHGWTTPGLDARRAAARADELPALFTGRRVVIAGFYALTGTEDAVFRALAEAGTAEIVWHTDAAIADAPESAHWTCREHRRWLEQWKTHAELYGEPPDTPPTRFTFHEGFDLHSQLGVLRDELAKADLTDTAVVLPDTGSLMPVLHHLPLKDVNISMGYPLARSSLFRLVETVLTLQETAQGSGRYHWREVVALIRHPYVKMLEPQPGQPLRPLLRELERSIRRGGAKFVDPFAWEPDEDARTRIDLPEDTDLDAALSPMRETLAACLTAFEAVPTLHEFGEALLGLARALVPEHGEHAWHRFPVDAECLYRLAASLVPAIADSHISRDGFDRPVLHAILRQLMRAERVPFEAEPLTGLQIIGMLESRLLRFSRVYVLDATEDRLPGATDYDPLLPDPLRDLLGLPDGRHRTLVTAYNFHRLVAGAEEAVILYQTGVSGSDKLGRKSVRSRFVEQLLWEEEKRRGTVIEPGEPPLFAIPLNAGPMPRPVAAVPRTPAIDRRLDTFFKTRELSPTSLDSYLQCPLRFFHERLTPLSEPDAVSEEGDHMELGTLVHEVLQQFLKQYVDVRTKLFELDPAPLLDAFSSALAERQFYRQMPYDMRLGLESSGRQRLASFLRNSPETTILDLERKVVAALPVDDADVRLTGTFDRVDARPEGRVVLDYKTGTLDMPQQSVWTRDDLWLRMEDWQPGDDPTLLADLHKAVKKVQLPVYCWLYWREEDTRPANAAWVELKDRGEEKPLFTSKSDDDLRDRAVTELTPALVRFIVRHMRGSERFDGHPGRHCQYCPYGFSCPTPKEGFAVRR